MAAVALLFLHGNTADTASPDSPANSEVIADSAIHPMQQAWAGKLPPELLNAFVAHSKDYLPKIKQKVVTLIDFSLPSTAKRLWTIDLESGECMMHTWVAHGRNSGENDACSFSNIPQSYQSSLGFYLTGETYEGKHGYSLRLHGLEAGINDNALDRAIVVHGADYVSEDFIQTHGRLGRSHGCPALPTELTQPFIDLTKEGSLLFIYHPGYTQLAAK